MSLHKFKNLSHYQTKDQIECEILNLQKILLDLRVKKALKQNFKPHLFKLLKTKLAQLNFKKKIF